MGCSLYSVVVGSNGGHYFCNRMITFLFSKNKTSSSSLKIVFLSVVYELNNDSSGSSGHHAERAAIFMSKAGSTFHCFY